MMHMINNDPDLRLNVCFDREIAWCRGDSCRYLVIEVSARETEIDAKRPRHDLAIAIDASSSMSGALPTVQQLAKGLVDRLESADSIAIISFADVARTELASIAADDAGKAAARSVIDGIELRSGSNFADGWLAAAEQVASARGAHQ